MTPLLELEQGDINRLDGRVIIYARCPMPEDAQEGEMGIGTVAMFFSTHPTDFVDRFGVPEGGLENLAQQEAEAYEDMDAGTVAMVPIYGAPIELDDTDLAVASEDVVFAGEYSHPQMCMAGVQIAAQLYVLRYSEQLLARSGMIEPVHSPRQEQSQEQGLQQEPPATYQSIARDEMGDYLQAAFIAPIMLALEEDDQEKAVDVVRDFIRFCGPRGPLTDDAYALAEAVRTFPSDQRIPILYKYFEKILAVANERFEDAARLRDAIRLLQEK